MVIVKSGKASTLQAEYSHLNTEALQTVVRLAQNAFQVSLCGLALFNDPDVWVPVSYGLSVPDLPTDDPFCRLLIHSNKKNVVSDISANTQLASSQLVTQALGLTSLISIPIVNGQRERVGALFLMDKQSRKLLPHENQILMDMAALIHEEVKRNQNSRALPDVEQQSVDWRMDFALSHPAIGVWEANPRTGCITWDQRMRALHYLLPGACVERWDDWLNLIVDEQRERVKRLFAEYQKGADPGVIRFKIELDGNAFRHIECRGSHYYDEYGEWQSTIGTSRDVTDQVLAEIALKQQSKLAVRALEAKSNFIACMSHEIRTPMNGVLGIIDLLSRSELNDTQREQLAIAQNSGNSLVSIMNDILDFSKLESDKVDFEWVEFDLAEEVAMVVEGLRPLAKQKSLNYTLNSQLGDSYKVSGDPIRTRQIFNNLISNAIKFTEEGAVQVEVSSQKRDDESEWVEFSVSDTGIGVEEEKMGSLFQMFTQADSSTTRRYGGTGIGLAIVKRIIEKMSGEIAVVSEPGQGSCFYGKVLVNSVEQSAFADLKSTDVDVSFDGYRVLLVEDVRLNQVVATIMLEELGIEPVVVEDGQKALNTLLNDEDPFDFIFMDCEMPIMDGFMATEKIRQGDAGDRYKGISIVALTAHVSDEQKHRAAASGMDGFVSKPISQESIVGALEEFLKKKR